MAGVSFPLSILRFSFSRCPVSSLTCPTHIYHHALFVLPLLVLSLLVVPLPLPEVLIAEAERHLPKTLAAGALDKAALGGIMASIVREPSPIDGHGGPHVGTFSPFFRNCFCVVSIDSLLSLVHWLIPCFKCFDVRFEWYVYYMIVASVHSYVLSLISRTPSIR